MGRGITSNHVTSEPDSIIPGNPVDEWEEIVEVAANAATGREEVVEPVVDGRLLLDVGIRRRHRVDGLALCQTIITGLVAIVVLDSEAFGQSMAQCAESWRGPVWKRHVDVDMALQSTMGIMKQPSPEDSSRAIWS